MSFCENIQSIIRNRNTNGTVLIVTIWIVLALAGLVLVFARSIRVEAIASANYVASVQAEAAAYGAVQFIIAQLSSSEDTSTLETENPYEQMQLGNSYFWLLRSNLADDKSYDFGITDESSKINLNLASNDMLLRLPGMTAELAAAIIDWRDEDSEIWPGGAESEYYLLLDEPYYCKNAPLETVEEVLLLRGASPEILYGEDMNRNGVLNDNENDAAESEPADNRDGHLDRGFYDYVTVYSAEENASQSGERRININQPSEELSELIRQVVTGDRYYQVSVTIDQNRRYGFSNILDFYFKSGLTYDEFERIADRITTIDEQYITGRVNVNLAPREVLLCLPGLAESDVDALIDKRTSGDVNLESIAWVAEALEPEKAVDIGNYITTARSTRFSADIVSTSGNGRAFRRYKVVLDMQNEPPSIIYWKELTYLGWPLDSEIISALRSGS